MALGGDMWTINTNQNTNFYVRDGILVIRNPITRNKF